MMTYEETVTYLYNCAPPFQQVGGAAYKEGLATTIAFDNHLGNPHKKFATIHVAGTNGKGSTSHTLAAILHRQLYTSEGLPFGSPGNANPLENFPSTPFVSPSMIAWE